VKAKGPGWHYYSVTLDDITTSLRAIKGKWPCRAGGLLFAVDEDACEDAVPDPSVVRVFSKAEQLFSWICKSAKIVWKRDCKNALAQETLATTKGELLQHLSSTAEPNYDGIEILPHYPVVPNCYYLKTNLPPANGEAWSEFLELLNPESDLDHELLQAAALTPGWGGPPGARPAFIFTSDYGHGVGKTSTAQLICDLWGGYFELTEHESWEQTRRSLTNDETIGRRCILIDNVKSPMRHSGLESLITATETSGWKLFRGYQKRPNRLTIFVTSNAPELSRDLIDRSVVLHIGQQKRTTGWSERARRFLEERRPQFLADALNILAQPPECTIEAIDRWSPWQQAILTRFVNGNELAKRIIADRPLHDADLRLAEDVSAIIQKMIPPGRTEHYLHKTELNKKLILESVFGDMTSPSITRAIRRLLTFEPLKNLRDTTRRDPRQWLWQSKKEN